LWVEIIVADVRNLLIGNHYFVSDIRIDIIKNCFNISGNRLATLNYHAIQLDVFQPQVQFVNLWILLGFLV
jgi:hypothetical protein